MARRSGRARAHYSGCSARQTIIGLEADGTVKGCPSLPTVGYAGGDIREATIEDIWRGAADGGALRPADDLWGFCGTCYYADVCRAGCTWTSHSLLGRPGNNPYCHHRALSLAAEGRRERVVKVQEAGPAAFAIGRFELVEEMLDGSPIASREVPAVPRPVPRPLVPTELAHCPGCQCFVREEEVACPFCAATSRRCAPRTTRGAAVSRRRSSTCGGSWRRRAIPRADAQRRWRGRSPRSTAWIRHPSRWRSSGQPAPAP